MSKKVRELVKPTLTILVKRSSIFIVFGGKDTNFLSNPQTFVDKIMVIIQIRFLKIILLTWIPHVTTYKVAERVAVVDNSESELLISTS